MKPLPLVLCLAALPLAAPRLAAEVRLPAVISDHMVLQRDLPAKIWGWADPGETVTVRFRGQTATATPGALGRWAVMLAPTAAGGPFELSVQGRNAITVRDVLVGEVWVASGQSNMEWTVTRSDNAQAETAGSANPQIRFFQVPNKPATSPQQDCGGKWEAASPETTGKFSAVAYYFSRHLNQQLKVPMGVLQSDWGGTPADAWTSLPALTADPALAPAMLEWARMMQRYPADYARYERAAKEAKPGAPAPRKPVGPGEQWEPAALYNGMIAPLVDYAIRGAIWYQGESNAGMARVTHYNRLFETMIRDWRRAWGYDFPFLFVQLANFRAGGDTHWPLLREAQTQTLALKRTGMAVTIDIGNPTDIHPTNKQDVGKRLALAARHIAYGERLVYSGPMYRQSIAEGGAMRLWFDHTGGGLQAKGGALKGFEIAGEDRKFVSADARIDGATLVVSSPSVAHPAAVRYAWAKDPDNNLYNAEGLPASPFRTDAWPETQPSK